MGKRQIFGTIYVTTYGMGICMLLAYDCLNERGPDG
jgi:hypothetical protein